MKKRGNGEGSTYRRKDGSWVGLMSFGRKPDGSLRRVSFAGKTRKEVQAKLTAAPADREKGSFAEGGKVTVGQWLVVWLSEYKKNGVRRTTFDSYEAQARYHLIPAIGPVKLKDLRPERLQALYNQKLASGLSAGSVRLIHQVIHGALDQAVKNQLVSRNVSDATNLPAVKKAEICPLTLEQARKLLGSIRGDRLCAAIALATGTGLRRGEILALRWQDIDLKAGTLNVRRAVVRVRDQQAEKRTVLTFQEPKTTASRRTIPIPEDVLGELKRHKAGQNREKLLLGPAYADGDLVFCTEDGRLIDPRNFNRHFDWLLKAAGLPHIRFHDLRHTFATAMLEIGESPKVVQEMLGHSTISMTLDTYSHVSLDLEKRAASRLNEALRGVRQDAAR